MSSRAFKLYLCSPTGAVYARLGGANCCKTRETQMKRSKTHTPSMFLPSRGAPNYSEYNTFSLTHRGTTKRRYHRQGGERQTTDTLSARERDCPRSCPKIVCCASFEVYLRERSFPLRVCVCVVPFSGTLFKKRALQQYNEEEETRRSEGQN